MVYALVLVTVAFLVTLFMLVQAKGAADSAGAALPAKTAASDRSRQLESELDKRRKELEENRRQMSELKDELKQTKRKLYEQKESDKENRDLQKARAELERGASVQLEAVRAELAAAQVEIDRLKGEAQARARRPEPTPAPVAEATQAAPALAPVVEQKPQRVIRELNDADREKMARLEHDAKKATSRAAELERELRKVKSRADTQNRLYVVQKGELDLLRDKYKALEKRMNRTLLQNDLVRRAIKDLERKTGVAAERTELSEDELQASDRQVEERAQAEATVRAEQARVAAEADKALEDAANAEPPAAPAEPAPEKSEGSAQA